MDIILVPGLWLDATSWTDVARALEACGHRPIPLTLPGMGLPAAESALIGMADWIDAAVVEIDRAPGPVALVGHSGAGNVVWGAADARPERVSRVVFVDTVPPPPGAGISEFAVVDGVIPFPGWDSFPEEDVYDLDETTRAVAAALTRSVPARVPTDPVLLSGGRHDVPVTILMGSMGATELEAEIDNWGSYGEEYRSIRDVTVTRIGSGHWPQFSQPDRLAELISESVSHSESAVDGDDSA